MEESLNDHHSFNDKAKGLAHSTTIGKLEVEIERKDIVKINLRDQITRLEKDVTSLTEKGGKYDALTVQGVRNMMIMSSYLDCANIR